MSKPFHGQIALVTGANDPEGRFKQLSQFGGTVIKKLIA